MSLVKDARVGLEKIVLAVVLFVTGILLCVNIDVVTLSVIVGALLVAYGVFSMLILVLKKRPLASKVGYFSCIIITVGIVLIAEKLLSVFVYMLPYVFIVVGSVLIIDAFLGKFLRMEASVTLFVIRIAVGAALVAFAICLLTISSFAKITPISLGVILILAAGALVFSMFSAKKSAGRPETGE